MDDHLISGWAGDELLEVFKASSSDIVSLFWDLSKYFGESVCGVVAYSVGRVLGERLYRVVKKNGVGSLRAANELLVRAIKVLRLAKDAAVFTSRAEGGDIEIFFRISSSAQICGRNERPLLYIVRGFLFQFYSMFTSKYVTITSLDLSDVLRDCYEYVIGISEASPNPTPGRAVKEYGRRIWVD